RTRPKQVGQRARNRRQRAKRGGDLIRIGGDQRERAFGRASLHREQTRHRGVAERIDREPVQRVGRHGDDTPRANDARGLLESSRGRWETCQYFLLCAGAPPPAPVAPHSVARRVGCNDCPLSAAFRRGVKVSAQSLEIISLRTISARKPIKPTSTMKTARMPVAPRKPATTGLTAMPVSEALVSTPKPVPCAP